MREPIKKAREVLGDRLRSKLYLLCGVVVLAIAVFGFWHIVGIVIGTLK